MAAVVADVLGVALPARQEANAVGGEEAEERMANPAGMVLLFQEAVPAVARVLDEPVSHGHGVDAMTEQPTGISDLLGEALAMSKPVRTGGKNQRVTAANAHVLVHPLAVGQTNIGMVAQETGERVPNVDPSSPRYSAPQRQRRVRLDARLNTSLSTTCPHNAQLKRTSGARGSQDCRGIA